VQEEPVIWLEPHVRHSNRLLIRILGNGYLHCRAETMRPESIKSPNKSPGDRGRPSTRMLCDKTNIMSLSTAHKPAQISPFLNVCVVSITVSPAVRVSYAVSVLVPVDNHCIHGTPADPWHRQLKLGRRAWLMRNDARMSNLRQNGARRIPCV
jgi:hypothetical protein